MSNLLFIDLLNLSTVTFVKDLWAPGAGGWEAISPDGEIRAFTTFGRANAWRVDEVKRVYNWCNEKIATYDIDGTFAGYSTRSLRMYLNV